MNVSGDDVRSAAAAISAVVALGSFVVATGALRAASRTRNRLAAEVGIWKELPTASTERARLWEIIERRTAKLAKLEDPARRRRRWENIGWGFLLALILAGAAAAFWFGGGGSNLPLVLAALLFKGGQEAYRWWKRRHEPAAEPARPMAPEEPATMAAAAAAGDVAVEDEPHDPTVRPATESLVDAGGRQLGGPPSQSS